MNNCLTKVMGILTDSLHSRARRFGPTDRPALPKIPNERRTDISRMNNYLTGVMRVLIDS